MPSYLNNSNLTSAKGLVVTGSLKNTIPNVSSYYFSCDHDIPNSSLNENHTDLFVHNFS